MSRVLLDTGPLVALIDTHQYHHKACHKILQSITGQLYSTSAVLTEVFHFIEAGSQSWSHAAEFVKEFVNIDAVEMSSQNLNECFEMMFRYKDHPMDFADATLVVSAVRLNTQNIFTLDVKDFSAYRIKKGFSFQAFNILGLELL